MSDTPVDASKRTWLIASGCAGAVGGAFHRRSLRQQLPALRKGQGRRCPGGSGYLGPEAGRENDGRMARQAGVDHEAHARAARESLQENRGASWPTPSPSATTYPTPEYAKNEHRSIKPEVCVGVGICSHLGCSPSDKLQPGPQPSLPDDWQGGFLCPCHGSTFDLAGRVFKNKPAPDNLEVPPHMYLSDTRLLIGEDKKA